MNDARYDIVGDIHGHADPLHRLLQKLNYTEVDGIFLHPERQMIFVGDFIDRGPQQREVLRIARSMCLAGSAQAVMGNHEFNAIGWTTTNSQGEFLRRHSAKNASQHAEFLGQLGDGSTAYREAIEWFKTLPIWLDLPKLRVVHACWHDASCEALRPFLDQAGCLTEPGLLESYRRGSAAHGAVERLLKGPEETLPTGLSFSDKDGHLRREARLRWWDHGATTFRQAALGMDGRDHEMPDCELPIDYRYWEEKPVFFGHYWLRDTPSITANNAACLDFSVAKDGWLTAYRWSGEPELTQDALVYVPA